MTRKTTIIGEIGRTSRMVLVSLGLLGTLALAGCSANDDEQADGSGEKPVSLTMNTYVSSYSEAKQLAMRAGTRADSWPWTPAAPEGFVPYSQMASEFANQDDLTDKSIGVFFTQNDVTPLGGGLLKQAGSWMTSARILNNTLYFVYGYVPYSGISASISANSTYEGGAVLTLRGLGSVMSSDVCVTVGLSGGLAENEPEDLQVGKFSYRTANPAATPTPEENHMFLLFDHLYAALRLSFKVDADYNALRTIKVKNLRMKGYQGAVQTTDQVTVVVSLKANEDGTTPIESVTYTPTGSGTDGSTVFSAARSADEVTLDTDPSNFFGAFVPTLINRFVLHTTYDVYDKKGNLVRQNCEADNVIDIPSIFSIPGGVIERGKIYTVNLTVKPTYLYVLSDPDLDNPTITTVP